MLGYSGITRTSSDIHKANFTKELEKNQIKSLKRINLIAEKVSEKLKDHTSNFDFFASMLEESWDAKCSTFIESQNTEKLLKIYEKGINSGAICGKLLGAGGGGFFAFFVEQNRKKIHKF